MFVNPTIEISKYGKQLQEDKQIFIITLDDEESKIKRLDMAITESIKNGGWVIIENPQFILNWPKDILKTFYKIKDAKILKEENDFWEDYNLNIPEARDQYESSLFVHDNFRMWFICDNDQLFNLPESIIGDSIKITPKLSDLKQTYLSCARIKKNHKNTDKNVFREASMLHSLMTHNDFRERYFWY